MIEHLTDRERRCISDLAKRYKAGDDVSLSEALAEEGESEDEMLALMHGLADKGLLRARAQYQFSIEPELIKAADEIANPPRPDHLNTYTKWWRSKRLLVALAVFFTIAAVVVPLALSIYSLMPTEGVMESPEDKNVPEGTPQIQQR